MAEEPVDAAPARAAARGLAGAGARSCASSWPPSTRSTSTASCWPGSPAATASRATPTSPPYVERFVLEGQSARLSAAALETLAIVAYKQPVSRAQVAAIRGVNVDGVMRTLQHRGYIEEVARDPGPGQAVLYGTTRHVPREARARLARRPARARPVRPVAEVVEALEQGLRVAARRGRPGADARPTRSAVDGEPERVEGGRPAPPHPSRRRAPLTPTHPRPAP